ncbi:MAG: hypothetical protein IJ681_02395 [Bacteroidales bacterium]|nr:hypothetical protein [Bacteroidales bacterium]
MRDKFKWDFKRIIKRVLITATISFVVLTVVIFGLGVYFWFFTDLGFEALYMARSAPSREEIESTCPGKSKEEIDSIYNACIQETIEHMNYVKEKAKERKAKEK